jgi:hypothetical protein
LTTSTGPRRIVFDAVRARTREPETRLTLSVTVPAVCIVFRRTAKGARAALETSAALERMRHSAAPLGAMTSSSSSMRDLKRTELAALLRLTKPRAVTRPRRIV